MRWQLLDYLLLQDETSLMEGRDEVGRHRLLLVRYIEGTPPTCTQDRLHTDAHKVIVSLDMMATVAFRPKCGEGLLPDGLLVRLPSSQLDIAPTSTIQFHLLRTLFRDLYKKKVLHVSSSCSSRLLFLKRNSLQLDHFSNAPLCSQALLRFLFLRFSDVTKR